MDIMRIPVLNLQGDNGSVAVPWDESVRKQNSPKIGLPALHAFGFEALIRSNKTWDFLVVSDDRRVGLVERDELINLDKDKGSLGLLSKISRVIVFVIVI
jgi:hypothetical protein